MYILIFEIFLRAFKGVGGRKFCGWGGGKDFFFLVFRLCRVGISAERGLSRGFGKASFI